MKAVVFHGVGDIRLDDVPDPKIKESTDAIVRLTASAICGTDLHMIRGTFPGMIPGTILGHEGVGVVEEVGKDVRNLRPGDRVVIPSTIACGSCSYCRAGYHSQCDNANPNGKQAGTAFYGGPKPTGPFQGLQAEYARVPFGHVGCVQIPEDVTDDQAIAVSDIFPTGYFAADLAEIKPGETVVVFGCGPVGLFAIASARLMGAGRVLAVDTVPSRLEMARAQGAEVIDFNAEHPAAAVQGLTGGIGADRAIDCVGIDAVMPEHGAAAALNKAQKKQYASELASNAPEADPDASEWRSGNAPSIVFSWAVESLAKAGTFSIVGVYPPTFQSFPIGAAMNRNLTIRMGNCNHRRYMPKLIELVRTNAIDPEKVLTQREPLTFALDAYKAFDERRPGWIKVKLNPAS